MKKELYLSDKIYLKQNSDETKVSGDDLAKKYYNWNDICSNIRSFKYTKQI